MLTQAGSGVMINLGQSRDGTVLDTPIIESNGKRFSLLEASVMDEKGEVSFDGLNQALGQVASMGGLHGEPRTLVAITENASPVYAEVNYWNQNGEASPRIAKISSFSGGSNWPDLDVFLTNLTRSRDPGTVAPVLVVDPSVQLKPYGQNKVDDSVERIDNNPYKGLEQFVGKEYDGLLDIPELERFKGFKFGNGEWSYVYGVTHRGRNLGVIGFLAKLPKIGDKYEVYDSDWEIQAINHDRFDDDFTGKDPKYARKQFDQHLTLALKHLDYHPPMTPSEQRLKVVENDRLFWTRVASLNGFDLKEIDPQYTDKDPLTPWYEATHRETGNSVVLGTRWRVYSVAGNHISCGEPEEVNKYLSEIAKK
ncbi:hypothetical protein HY495_02730 [Candidatus Woesearchaeota archaeon]|nr:hypothetical protein [Candidatus Woesearchaeota archaeon]